VTNGMKALRFSERKRTNRESMGLGTVTKLEYRGLGVIQWRQAEA
jgi:hypothetical protein